MNTERHPFTPFLPDGCRLLMLGSFPPGEQRWSMRFYYPNFTNDMWRIFGICFFDDKNHFVVSEKKTYNLPAIIDFLNERGVALYDTARRVVRTKNTASDKDLMIVEQTDFDAMLSQLAQCRAVATAGQLATTVFCSHFGIPEPKVGGYTEFAFGSRMLRLYRMPSSSRAYPMKVEAKAEVYGKMFSAILLKSDKDNL